jgi:hypothetical protein
MSFRQGGVTSFAAAGYDEATIHQRGRWSSNAWEIYIWDKPLLQQLLA